uniref:RRM domain-containing protein n=17 Tax=Aves TaxID=8782 RepID=A0A803V6U4_FICAL
MLVGRGRTRPVPVPRHPGGIGHSPFLSGSRCRCRSVPTAAVGPGLTSSVPVLAGAVGPCSCRGVCPCSRLSRFVRLDPGFSRRSRFLPLVPVSPARSRRVAMVKLFIGNLPREATEQEIRSLFEQYGKVLECDIIKNYGFVHIEDKTAAEDAIRNLHHHKLHGVCINVEASKNKSKASTKLHVGNISPTCTNLELRAKFEEYGPVIECDIVKDYAFVHMERAEDAVEAIRGLDNTEFQGEARAEGAPGWEGAWGGPDLGESWPVLVFLATLCG